MRPSILVQFQVSTHSLASTEPRCAELAHRSVTFFNHLGVQNLGEQIEQTIAAEPVPCSLKLSTPRCAESAVELVPCSLKLSAPRCPELSS